MAPGEVIGGAAVRRHRIERRTMPRMQRIGSATDMPEHQRTNSAADTPEHSWVRWFDRGSIDSLGGSAERRSSRAAQAKAEFEYHRDTFVIPGF